MRVRTRATVAQFTRMIHSLLEAGYGLNESVRLLSRNDVSPSVRDVSIRIADGIRKGQPFSTAISGVKTSSGKSVFSEDYISWLSGVERTGNLAAAFASLDSRLEEAREARERFVSVLVYPAFVVTVSLVGTAVILFKAVPYMRARSFLDSASLDSMVGGVMAALAVLISLASAFAYAAYRVIGRESGEALIFSRLTDFAREGLPVVDAIPACLRAIGDNQSLAVALMSIRRDISSGKPLVDAFRNTERFSSFVTDMMLIGTNTGDLASVFSRVGAHYAGRDRRRREFMLRLSEPVVIAITGIYLAIILESTVIPLMTSMGGFF